MPPTMGISCLSLVLYGISQDPRYLSFRFGEVGGGCVTSTSGQAKVTIKPCQTDREDQLVEAGVDVEAEGGETEITPVSLQLYLERAESRRNEELEVAFTAVSEADLSTP